MNEGESWAARLRPRIDTDLAGLVELWQTSWQEAMPDIDFAARRGWFVDRIAQLEADGAATICAIDAKGTLLGFVTLDAATSYLDQLAVAPAAKGTPTAGLLLQEARRLSPLRLMLDVNQGNARAVRFYAREGFVIAGEGLNETSGLKTWRMLWAPA